MKQILDFFNVPSVNLPRLLTFSHMKNMEDCERKQHIHSYTELFYFEEGFGTFLCGKQTIPLVPNTLLWVNPSVCHTQVSSSKETPLIYYNFAVENAWGPERDFSIFSFDSKENTVYDGILRLTEVLKDSSRNLLCAMGIFYDVFGWSRALLFSSDVPVSKRESLTVCREYIETYYYKSISVEELAQISFLSESGLMHRFHKEYGISPMQYLNLIRVENAKILLLKSEDSISWIGGKVGFCSPSYFSEIFKKIEGISPSEFRKKLNHAEIFI